MLATQEVQFDDIQLIPAIGSCKLRFDAVSRSLGDVKIIHKLSNPD